MNENQNHKEILLVDDDPDYSELTRTRLEVSGYRVSCVSSGRAALELLENEYQPRLIIMDLDMPDRNGLSVLINMHVREKRRHDGKLTAPVIIASGFQSDKVKELVVAQNVGGYLKKPYDSEELLRTVKELIG